MAHPTDSTDALGFLRLAEDIAREAGEMLLAKRPGMSTASGDIETKSSPTDVVTALDKASEQLIRARIQAARPGDRILGEEEGEAGGDSAVRWIVDPIDGTVNFLYGLPEWAVSIAVEVAGRIVAGVVNVVPRGEVFTAALGAGAHLSAGGLGGERLRCNTGVPLERALVATGFGYGAGRRAVQGEVVAAVLPRVRDIRRGGSCAVDLCSVAAGRVDAYYERGVNRWDYAAAGLVASEAGARMGGLNGEPAGPGLVLCAAPDLFEGLHDLLASLDPDRDA